MATRRYSRQQRKQRTDGVDILILVMAAAITPLFITYYAIA